MASLITSSMAMLAPRDLWSDPPPTPRTRDANNPTLLYSWWCTAFACAIIITRLCGRKTRSNELFREDWIMMFALVPLFVRMSFIHVVILYGTNNVQTVGVHYTQSELDHRSIGSRLVLAARIFYAMFIWTCKLTVSEFLKRITLRMWRRSYEVVLQGVRVFLVITFFVVVIATLCDCQPFNHYWQVQPDPGPHCRQGYGNLIAMGTCDIITDILLVAFPIPIILRSGQTWKRKFQLVSLFSLSIILIIVTALRVPKVIAFRGRQQYRTVWASSEILAAAAVSNVVIIGSFLRDKGTKKNKYKSASVSDSIDNTSMRRPTVTALQDTGSDENLFRFLGIRVPEHLQDQSERAPRPAPAALPASASRNLSRVGKDNGEVTEPRNSEHNSSDSDDSFRKPTASEDHPRSPSPVPSSNRAASFFDIGGLLENGTKPSTPDSRSRETNLVDFGHNGGGTTTHDFAPSTPSPSQSRRGSRVLDFAFSSMPSQSRRDSRTAGTGLLSDVGHLLTPTTTRASSGIDRYHGRRQSDSHLHPPPRHTALVPTGILGPMLERTETHHSLQDAGGLLGEVSELQTLATQQPTSTHTVPGTSRSSLAYTEPEGVDDRSYELEDLGDISCHDHQPDASAAAMQRASTRSQRNSTPNVLPPAQQPSAENRSGWKDLNISDPGGLLGR